MKNKGSIDYQSLRSLVYNLRNTSLFEGSGTYFPALLDSCLRVPILREEDIEVNDRQVFRNI
jgi:hypothetical protein